MRPSLALTTALIALCGSGAACTTVTPAPSATPKVACASLPREVIGQRLQKVLDDTVARGSPKSAVLHVECGGRVWDLASGVADAATGRRASAQDRFRAGSILKPAVATVVLQLAEEGRLKLDDPITDRISDRYTRAFKDADKITLRMLLTHRSGIGEWTEIEDLAQRVLSDPSHEWKPEEFITIAAERGPKFAPGTSYAYNNTGYLLLGLAIEQATGRPWREEVMRRVLSPVGIPPEALLPPGSPAQLGQFQHGYMLMGERELDVTDIDTSMAGPAGGHAFSPTAAELSRMLEAMLSGRLFRRPDTLSEMLSFGPANDPDTSAGLRTGYGLGLGLYRLSDGDEAIGHSGGTAGCSSLVIRIPRLGAIIAGAISVDHSAGMARLGDEVHRVLEGEIV